MTPAQMRARAAAINSEIVNLQNDASLVISSDAGGFFSGQPLANIKAADGVLAGPGPSAGSAITMYRYDFGRPVHMLQYSLTGFLWFDGGSYYSCTVTVDFSNDGSSWTNVGTHTIGVGSTSVALTNISGTSGAYYRYARIRVTAFGTNAYLQGDQFRITGYE